MIDMDGIGVWQCPDGRYFARIDWVDYPCRASTTVADLIALRDRIRCCEWSSSHD